MAKRSKICSQLTPLRSWGDAALRARELARARVRLTQGSPESTGGQVSQSFPYRAHSATSTALLTIRSAAKLPPFAQTLGTPPLILYFRSLPLASALWALRESHRRLPHLLPSSVNFRRGSPVSQTGPSPQNWLERRYLQILLQLDKRQGKILETQYNNRKIYFTKIMTDVTHPVCLSHSSEEGHGFLGASSFRINTTRLATKARSSDLPIS